VYPRQQAEREEALKGRGSLGRKVEIREWKGGSKYASVV